MDKNVLFNALSTCSTEKNIDSNVFAEIFKKAIMKSITSKYGDEAGKFFDINIDLEKKDIQILLFKVVVKDDNSTNCEYSKIKLSDAKKISNDFKIGETCAVDFDFNVFTKEEIFKLRKDLEDKIRVKKMDILYDKYSKLCGKVVLNVKVYQFYKGYISLGGKTIKGYIIVKDENDNNLILPYNETIGKEKFTKGQNVKAVVKNVYTKKGECFVVLSRIIPDFLKGLLEDEIQEIADGLVVIKNISRISGIRSKVVVESIDMNIDPISTCIGVRGSKINSVSKELNGEYIDFIKYTDNINDFIARALGITTVKKIRKLHHGLFVYVDPEEFGLAVGKNGNNIKLVRMLLNMHIDILKYSELNENMSELPVETLMGNGGIHEWIVAEIKNGGFETLQDILNMSKEDFEKKIDLEKETIEEIYSIAEEKLNISSTNK